MNFYESKKYCNSLTKYSRYKTREVFVGDVPLGNFHPIRIQSMTTTDTMDTIGTVEQTIRMINSGCEYVRITAPSLKDAENLKNIKAELTKRGYNVPLIADIHFTPNAAELAARIVEKVRVNPGNYVDKKKFQTIEYTDLEYKDELEKIRDRFVPLVKICKEYGTAMRIGTNHGSLSDRITSRFGDTPEGMVESALEFLRICEDENYFNIVLSMKASNTQVMVQAYRLLINKMETEGMNFPLHLGVTEAGDGEDGRIKSAVGIGTLLEDGIGDTVRVSLTEPPEFEAPVAISLVKRYSSRATNNQIPEIDISPKNPFEYKRRTTLEVGGIGGINVPKVFADFSDVNEINYDLMHDIGYDYNVQTDKWNIYDQACDLLYLANKVLPFNPPGNLKLIFDHEKWISLENKIIGFPFFSSLDEFISSQEKSTLLNFVELRLNDLFSNQIESIKNNSTVVFELVHEYPNGMIELRRAFFEMMLRGIENPVIIRGSYKELDEETFQLYSSTDYGALLIDGFGDGICLSGTTKSGNKIDRRIINRTSFGILQACRTRISKTEYIACPSCGRTLFELVETTNKIRKQTGHLKGLKIAIMGCIVNGPGEMADADYGYVGSGVGKITLYRGKEIVKRNIQSENALQELILLLKADGKWFEPINS